MQDKEPNCPDSIRKNATLAEAEVFELESVLNQCYCALGKHICEISGSRIAEINALVDNLVSAKLKLAELREEVICSGCLTANPASHLFCGKCGRPLDSETNGGTT